MAVSQTKHNFTAGEVSPLIFGRQDFDRFKNGCRSMKNMVSLIQGPATRRSGFQYMASLSDLGLDSADPKVRLVEFIFNETQAYVLVFFKHTDGSIKMVVAVDDGLLVFPDPAPTECPSGSAWSVNPGDVFILDMPTGWDIDNFTYAQSGDNLYCAQSTLNPHVIIRYDFYCWTVDSLTFTDQPADWSSTYGWPETVTFFQQRLVFGGNKLRRQTVWCSRAGDFTHFGALAPTALVDADAVSFTLDSGTQNKILWMQTVKQLHIGTVGNEWIVTGNGQNAITPSSVLTQSPTNQGSQKIRPLRVGLTTLFIEQHGRVVNEFSYDYNYDSYKASDITILAPHLTEYFSISRWCYQQTPNSIVWCVREDGTLLGLTYQRQHNVVAWHVHDTDGAFIDVCSVPGINREDDLWAIVRREIEGVDQYYLEKKAQDFKGTTAEEGKFLDSFLQYEGGPALMIEGLEHLEGKEVYILSDGSVHPPRTVEDGTIYLQDTATNVLVGLYYYSEVNPLLTDAGTDKTGTTITRIQRILELNLELYRSLGFEIGTYDIDGVEYVEEKSFRVPSDLTNTALPLFTGTYKVDGFEGSNDHAEYFIRQRQPLPLTVIGVVNRLEVK